MHSLISANSACLIVRFCFRQLSAAGGEAEIRHEFATRPEPRKRGEPSPKAPRRKWYRFAFSSPGFGPRCDLALSRPQAAVV